MEQILLLIFSWIPVPVELTFLLILLARAKKIIKDAVSIPEKQLKATQALQEQVKNQNSQLTKVIEENEQLHKDNVELKLELRGHRKYGKDEVKKN